MERYVTLLEEKGLYEIQRSAGMSFLQKESVELMVSWTHLFQ